MKTYGDVLREYEFHPESKYSDVNGNQCSKQALGLLHRRHIRIEYITLIGKEFNELEDVESGMIHEEKSVYTEYPNPKYDEWRMKILPAPRKAPLSLLVKESGMSPSALKEIRAGRSRPHGKHQGLFSAMVRQVGLI